MSCVIGEWGFASFTRGNETWKDRTRGRRLGFTYWRGSVTTEEGQQKVSELTTRLSSSISFYKTLLGIRTVMPISETSVQLEYDIPSSNPITLLLEYDPVSRRLVDASVSLPPSSPLWSTPTASFSAIQKNR